MKTIFNDYIKIVIYLICGILVVMSSYIIILNVNHYNSLLASTVVSEIDNDYLKYKDNIELIEEFVNNSNNSNGKLTKVLEIMKKDGVYRLIPKTKLNYKNLYNLNDYFMEELINNGWVSNLKSLDESNKYQDTITLLVNNSKYLNDVLTNNSFTLYDSNLDNSIEDNYHFILSNYRMYANVILNICNELGGTSG